MSDTPQASRPIAGVEALVSESAGMSPCADYATRLASAARERGRVELTAEWILSVFDSFYAEFLKLTWAAKAAFQSRDHPTAIANARKRLGLYNATVYPLAEALREAFPKLTEGGPLWTDVEAVYRGAVHGRYEADLALAYLHSVQRRVHHGEWKPVEYGFGGSHRVLPPSTAVYARFPCSWPIDSLVIQRALQVAELTVPFCDLARDAELVARRVNDVLADRAGAGLRAFEMVRAGFFRNRGAYLVGRLVLKGTELKPLVIALLNSEEGVRAEAVLHAVPHVHNLCSSTEAPFQVTNRHYHELAAFLKSIMPSRPLGLHYSTIGYYHFSKVAVMNEVRRRLVREQGRVLVFKYLIAQRKLTPLNVFLETAPEEKAVRAMINLGFCMRNNAAANVFNKDFDIRNYGVSRYLKIYLYDYDAVETLTDVQVRTNRDRCDGEEDVPSWFFEPGVIFLPEEIEAGLRVRNRTLRRAFRAAHADLMSVEYWEGLQQALRAGEVPGIHTFPESCHLRDWGAETIAIE